MDERPSQPAEGKLIADALQRSGMSIREASAQAGISYGRWRQIASGYQNVSPGSFARVTGPAGTVARMAWVVRISPGQLDEAGRPDAAEALRDLIAMEPSHDDAAGEPEVLTDDERAVLEAYRQAIRAGLARRSARHGNGRTA